MGRNINNKLWLDSLEDIYKKLHANSSGLSSTESQARQLSYGKNLPPHLTSPSPSKIFLNQFKNSLIILLIIISIFSFFVAKTLDGIIILGMLFINAVIGFVQEFKAEKSLEKLKNILYFERKY